MLTRILFFCCLLTFSTSHCFAVESKEKKSPEANHHQEHEEETSVTKGAFGNVPYFFRSQTYFTGHLNAEALPAMQKEAVKVVINLLTAKEMKWDEKAAVKKAGITYYNIPVAQYGNDFDKKTFAQVEKTFLSHHHKGEKVLVHSGAGGRAASWFAYHLFNTHHDSVDNAIVGAKSVGLKDAEEPRIRKTLAAKP